MFKVIPDVLSEVKQLNKQKTRLQTFTRLFTGTVSHFD